MPLYFLKWPDPQFFFYHFQGTVAYYLLLDNRFRVSSGYLGAEFQESMVSICFEKQLSGVKLFVTLFLFLSLYAFYFSILSSTNEEVFVAIVICV